MIKKRILSYNMEIELTAKKDEMVYNRSTDFFAEYIETELCVMEDGSMEHLHHFNLIFFGKLSVCARTGQVFIPTTEYKEY